MQIRAATASDFESIVRLVSTREELFYVYPNGKHPFSINQLEALAESRTDFTVVVENDEVIGFANLYNVNPPKSAFIGNVVVSRNFRGHGIGRRLVSHMIQQTFDKYLVEQVQISVFNDNTPALLLYIGLHFQPYAIEERSHPSGSRVGLLHMRLERSRREP